MIVLRALCALAVVGVCWGEAALHPESRQGPQHDLHSAPHYDVYNTLPYNVYNNPRYNVYDDLDNDVNHGVYRSSTVGFHNTRQVNPFIPHRTAAVSALHSPPVIPFNAPPVTAFNAPAVTSFRGSTVIPNPYLIPPKVHVTLPHHDSPTTVHKTPLPYASPVPQPKPVIPIKSQYHVQDELGQYSFGYDAGISTRQETRDAYGTVRGSFSYIDSNGELQTQHYVAGKNGFQVRGTNLPVHVTNEARYKRSYATFPAATGPLTTPHHLPDLNTVTPYYVYGPPRRGFSYSLQALPSTSHRIYYSDFPLAPHRGYYY